MSGFTFGTPTTQSGTKPGGLSFGSFGAAQTTSSSTPAFGFGLPATSKSTTTPSGFSFGVSQTTTTAGTATTQPAFGLSTTTNLSSAQSASPFGLKTTTTSAAPTASQFGVSPAVTSTSSGFSFGASAKPSSGLSFGTPATSTTVTTTSTSGFNLGSTPSQAPTSTTSAATSSAPFSASTTSTAFSLIASVAKTSTPSTTVTSSSAAPTASSQSSAPSNFTYRQLEEFVNKWTYELDEQSRNFESELSRLNKADALLIANADKISDLHAKVEACKAGQYRIDQELEFVETQQRALEDLLEPLEQAVSDLLPSQQHADAEREAIFQMCINTDLELGQLLSELREMAERVNAVTAELEPGISSQASATNAGAHGDAIEKSSNVIGQVTRILNSHMHALSWLSQNTRKLSFLPFIHEMALTEEKNSLLPIRRVLCNQGAVRAVRFNSDGQYCLTAGGNRTIRLWNPEVGRLLKTYTGHGGEVSDVQIGSGGADTLVVLWDVASGQSLRRWRKHAGRVNAVRFAGPAAAEGEIAASSSLLLLSVGVDGMLLVWDARARTPYPIQTMHEAKDSVNCLTVRRWQIITGSVDRCVRIYDVRKGIMTEDYIGYPVTSVGLSFDGQCLLVATQDSVVRLFDYTNGELLNRYTGHVNKDYRIDCCFLNDDAQIVSGSEDPSCKVVMWNLLNGGAADSEACLDHSQESSAWSTDIGAKEANEPPANPVPFIHSLSPHPHKNAILTAGGDYFWLWKNKSDED